MKHLLSTARRLVPDLARGTPTVYFLRLRSGALWIGATGDLIQHLQDHCAGRVSRVTRNDPPENLLRVEVPESLSSAAAREAQVKRWPRAKKEALVAGLVTPRSEWSREDY